MDFNLGSFLIGSIIGFLLIPLWKLSSTMCNQIVEEKRNKKKVKYKKKKSYPYKRKKLRDETKN